MYFGNGAVFSLMDNFLSFIVMQEFDLIEKGELAPLNDLIESIIAAYWQVDEGKSS